MPGVDDLRTGGTRTGGRRAGDAPSGRAGSDGMGARPPLSAPGGRTPAKAPRPLDERAQPRVDRRRTDRPTRWQLLRRRQRRLLRPAAWTLAVLLAAGGAALLARGAQPGAALATMRDRIAGMSSLRIEKVVFEGRTLTPEPMLRAALGVSVGDKLLGFSLDAARQRIEAMAWVQHATVERRLSGAVVVQLTERKPFAVWQNAGKFMMIDRAGQSVAELDPVKDGAVFPLLPLVVGAGAPETAAALLDQVAAQPGLKPRVAAAVRVGERRWNLRLTSGADVLLPEGQEAAALTRLMELQASQALLDRPLQVLDLRLPDRLVVRPQPEPRAPASTNPRRPT